MNPFTNGAGKLFVYHLLNLTPHGPHVRVRVARSDPRHDWCGVNLPDISGLVDLAVVQGTTWKLVGEVKSDYNPCFLQIVAAMHSVAVRQGSWPYGMWRISVPCVEGGLPSIMCVQVSLSTKAP